MDASFEYLFPAIRGIQSQREYYISMCPLRLLTKIFVFDEEELKPELRAQRILNKSRIPLIADYIVKNRDNYVFSAITASIDGDVKFVPLGDKGEVSKIGQLRINMHSKFIINDGQHRRAAIEAALRDDPSLGDETIAVVFFMDRGLQRCQQMFADLNLHASRPSKSLGLLYDHRDDRAALAKLVAAKAEIFKGMVETEKSSLSPRSRKLFTLSAIYTANKALLEDMQISNQQEAVDVLAVFWDGIGKHMREWQFVRDSKMTAGEIRQDFIHSHGIVLQALGIVGNALIRECPKTWKTKLKALDDINWSRSNYSDWEGRAMIGGGVSKAAHNVTLTANFIKNKLALKLAPEEQKAETAFEKGRRGKTE